MKSFKTNRSRNEPNKGYRVKKTISRDATSQDEQMKCKLYIFRLQEQSHERSNRKSTYNSSRSPASTPMDTESERDLTNTRARHEMSLGSSRDASWRKLETETAATEADDLSRADAERRAFEATVEAQENAEKNGAKDEISPPIKKEPIKFKDAVGRKFNFPFDLGCTWKGMEELIKQAFLQVEVIGPHVDQGHYDLVGPNGDIILPQVWESVIEPGWTITMHMWPIPETHDRPGGSDYLPTAASRSPRRPNIDAKWKKGIDQGPPRPSGSPGGFATWMMGRRRPPKVKLPVQAEKSRRLPG